MFAVLLAQKAAVAYERRLSSLPERQRLALAALRALDVPPPPPIAARRGVRWHQDSPRNGTRSDPAVLL